MTSGTKAVIAVSLSALLFVVACSAGTSGVGTSGNGGAAPEGATSQQCAALDSCPSIACDCGASVVNSRLCVDGYCLDEAHTCAATCGTSSTTVDGSTSPGKDGSAPNPDGTPIAASEADPCVPVSTSTLVPRVAKLEALAAAHQVIPATPANGTVNVSKTTQGKLSHVAYDADGYANDYTEDFSYNASGLITHFSHDADGYTNDLTEDFSYGASGLVTHWSYDANGSATDSTLDVSYTSSGGQSTLSSHGPRASGASVHACQ